jgi:beta-glucosidase
VPNSPLLPDSFLFGVATAGFQIEGGYNGDGEPQNNWAQWEHSGTVEQSGSAIHFYDNYETHLDLAQELGLNSFRLSIEWTRVEPTRGVIDDAAVQRYRSILEAMRRRHLEPIVTLHHFTHPAWLGAEPWADPANAHVLAQWMRTAVERFGDLVTQWVTINEPNALCLNTFFTGIFPPGKRFDAPALASSFDTLINAHLLGVDAIKERQATAVVTTNPYTLSLFELDQLATDLLMAKERGISDADVVSYLLEQRRVHYKQIGNGGHGGQGVVERFLRRICAAQFPVAEMFKNTRATMAKLDRTSFLDVVAVDHYAPIAASHLVVPGRQSAGGRWYEPGRALWDDQADPAFFGRVLDEAGAYNKPVWVLENGMANRVRRGRSFARMDGLQRPTYLNDHLKEVVAAHARGVDVAGYWHWTLIDNYEWGSYEPRFGIFGMERERGLEIRSTDSLGDDAGGAYRRIIDGIRSGNNGVFS